MITNRSEGLRDWFALFWFTTAEYITSQKGKPLIKLNGYTFCSTPAKGPKVRWRCSTHYPHGCRAALVTFADEILSIRGEHNHKP
ncbi:unnamed protein product [Parnassius apollo]|uniref:(apollo) hypothetical protein n=1 Tax=Parnassius apollo TaxID=110799 RepID=A0A8S3W0T9_PARAO|nr:unnamed protein product [Parnassius apollo]